MSDKIEKMIQFSLASMQWCNDESSKSVNTIMEITSFLFNEAIRVSKVSDEAVKALNKIRLEASELATQEDVSGMTMALCDIRHKHQEISEIVDPIIHSLQFQDRINQNLQNFGKMLEVWWACRQQQDCSAEEFGKKLMESTTMEEERDILRSYISGLPEEETTSEDVVMF